MEWFEQQDKLASRVASISPDHPGIETVQSCASYIRRHGVNTTLVTTDVRKVISVILILCFMLADVDTLM
jgi:hypothetical protein